MTWYTVVLKTAFITHKLTCMLVLLRFQAGMKELQIQYLLKLCDPLSSSWKKSDAEQGSALSCFDYSLPSG